MAVALCLAMALSVAAAQTTAPATRGTPILAPAATRPEVEVKPDPKVLEIIDKLGEGESANLPAFKTAGELNNVARRYQLDKFGPGERNYCIKVAWMPDRKRAIYYGANHGAPHRLNDVWEYDLPSNTWVCLYGPDANKGHGGDWSDVDEERAKKDGVIMTRRGGPAIIPHSWWNMTYDPVLRAMVTPCTWSMSDPRYFNMLQAGPHKPPMWAFFPAAGKWQPITGSAFVSKPPVYENARLLEYLPELGGTVWVKGDGMFLFNSVSNTWTQMKPNGGDMKSYWANIPDREQVACYLPDRHLIVAHSFRDVKEPKTRLPRTTLYDIVRNEWKQVYLGKLGDENLPPPGFDAATGFAYDRTGKVCLLTNPGTPSALWSFDPETAKWSKVAIKGPPPPPGIHAGKLFYDADRNVTVVPGFWVYRHRKSN